MKKLKAYYFSGTGNTRYAAERLCYKLSTAYEINLYDICDKNFCGKIEGEGDLLFAYPVYGSAPPIPMREFLYRNRENLRGRDAFIAVTQFAFSGDGAASLGRAAEKYGARVRCAEHFRMPNNISDCGFLKVEAEAGASALIKSTNAKIDRFAETIKSGNEFRRGFGTVSRAVGYLSQRALFRKHEESKRNKLDVDSSACTGCGKCVRACPVGNLELSGGKCAPRGKCVLCYRCVNLCPQKALRIFGSKPPKTQYRGLKFDKNFSETP